MKLEYSVTEPNIIQVSMGIKPASTTDLGLSEEYTKEITLTVDCTVEGEDINLENVPELILNHAVSSMKVEVQGDFRPPKPTGGWTKASYEKAYDAMKETFKTVQKYTVTLEKSRARGTSAKTKLDAKKTGAIQTLMDSYPKNFQSNAGKVVADIMACETVESVQDVLVKTAQGFEKANMK